MKSTTAILTVKLLGDDQTAKAFKEAQSRAQKFEAGLNKAAGVATAALGGLAAAGLGAALAAEAVASANAVVANVLGNMGMDKATDRVLAYADGLEKSLGIDEKVIKTTQGKLATFSELAASADVAGGAFDRATMAALDMASAGFGTAEGNAVQLGKALQDPIKGITALQKSGITFTEEQKKMIEAMVEAGDVAGAQDLILGELEKQVGGTAEANADASAKMQLAFGEVAETVGTALLPILDALLPKVQEFADWAAANTPLIMQVGSVVAGVAAAVLALKAAMAVWNTVAAVSGALTKAWGSSLGMALRLTIAQSAAIVKDTAARLANNAATIAGNVANAAKNALMLIGQGITIAVTAAQAALNLVMAMNPIVLVVMAVMLLIGVLVLAYQKSDKFREIVNKVGSVLKGIFMGAVNAVREAVNRVWNVLKGVGAFLSTIFQAAWDNLRSGLDKVKNIFNGVKDAVKGVWDWFKNLISKAGELFDKLNPFKGLSNLFGGGGKARVMVAGAAPAGRAAGPVVYTRATGYNPQREAIEIARLLGGATVRTGFRGVRAA